MQLHTNKTKRVVLDTNALPWQASSAAGVERQMLYRDGNEVAIATSVVRYAPGSSFPEHQHDLGEEFLVLDGVFSDERGDFHKGSYVRNPPGSTHSPFTKEGATIFVALRQFQERDNVQVSIDTANANWLQGAVDGLEVMPLHSHSTEHIALVRWAPGTQFHRHTHMGGEEILVLDGVFEDEFGKYPKGTWLRNPHGSHHQPRTPQGALIYVRVGHLVV